MVRNYPYSDPDPGPSWDPFGQAPVGSASSIITYSTYSTSATDSMGGGDPGRGLSFDSPVPVPGRILSPSRNGSATRGARGRRGNSGARFAPYLQGSGSHRRSKREADSSSNLPPSNDGTDELAESFQSMGMKPTRGDTQGDKDVEMGGIDRGEGGSSSRPPIETSDPPDDTVRSRVSNNDDATRVQEGSGPDR